MGYLNKCENLLYPYPLILAEGYGRKHKAEYNQFLSIAYGSLLELETQFLLANDLKYVSKNETVEKLLKEVGSMLYRMLYPIR
ncbi:hypothetical protein ES703_106808 [subsurface metagenome]